MPRTRTSIALVLAVAGLGVGGAASAESSKRHRGHSPALAPVRSISTTLAAAASTTTPAATSGPSSFGRVQFITSKRAYLDRGALDGLVPEQTLQLLRGSRNVGACHVEAASDHDATCVGARPRVGDTFRVPPMRRKKARPHVPVLAPVVDEQTLVTRAGAVADAAIDKVEFTGRRAFRTHATAVVTPGFSVWFTQPDASGGAYAQERIDGTIRGVPLGATGFQFDGAFSAMRWNTPATLERFRPAAPTQFYLWEAESSRRAQEGGTTIAVGRLWPFHTPGLTLLDGAQLGRQNGSRTAEGGFYGGLIPTAAGLSPTFDILAGGLYGALTQVGTKTGTKTARLRLSRQEARIGVWRTTGAGVVTEAEGLAQAWIGRVTVGAGGRLRWAPQAGGGRPAVEHAYADLGVRPSTDSAAGLHVRYVGVTLLPDAPLRAETPMLAGAIHATADARLNLSPRFGLAANAGAHREGETGRHQIHGGLEVRLPRLFGEGSGIWLGAEAVQGWMRGADVYAQFVGHSDDRLQVVARLSGEATQFETPTLIWNLHELAGYLSIDGTLTRWLQLRAWSMLRAPVLVQGGVPAGASVAGAAGLSVAGSI